MDNNLRTLPTGWRKQEVFKRAGLSTGKSEVFYISPEGVKVFTKASLAKILGKRYDITLFDFRSGRMINNNRKRIRHQDFHLSLPIRQTASIFKQPVTLIRNRTDSKTKTTLQTNTKSNIPSAELSQPRQIFWEKRMQSMKACDSNQAPLKSLSLPKNIKGVGPDISDENTLQSIAAALHTNTKITGQKIDAQLINKDPHLNIVCEQPLIQHVTISEYDIIKQESLVSEARQRLKQILALDKEIDNVNPQLKDIED